MSITGCKQQRARGAEKAGTCATSTPSTSDGPLAAKKASQARKIAAKANGADTGAGRGKKPAPLAAANLTAKQAGVAGGLQPASKEGPAKTVSGE